MIAGRSSSWNTRKAKARLPIQRATHGEHEMAKASDAPSKAPRLKTAPWMSDMGPILSSGQGEAAATTVVGAAASVTG